MTRPLLPGLALLLAGTLAAPGCTRRAGDAHLPGPSPTPVVRTTPPPSPSPSPTPSPDILDALSPEEQRRLLEIVQNVVSYGSYPYGFNHRDVWEVLRKLGPLTSDQVAKVKERLGGPVVRAERLFWEDALLSLSQGTPVTSEHRRKLETGFLGLGLMTQEEIDLRAERMAAIASRQPVSLPGLTVVVDEEVVSRVIGWIDRQVQPSLNALFEREPVSDTPVEARIREYGATDETNARLGREYREDEGRTKDLVLRRERSRTDAERRGLEKSLEEIDARQQLRLAKWKARVDAYRAKVYRETPAGS